MDNFGSIPLYHLIGGYYLWKTFVGQTPVLPSKGANNLTPVNLVYIVCKRDVVHQVRDVSEGHVAM